MKTKLNEFRIYAPPDVKSYGLNEDGTLTITGIASTTNEDLDGEIVSPNALESLAEQVIGLNLHLDHNHHYDGGIGVINDAELENSSLRITAKILPEFAKGILERLGLGMKFGFSIGGIPIINSMHSNVINDFKLLEVSLTLLPANWDTFGTVETKGLVESKCLTGACHYILKEKRSDKMKDESIQITDDIKQEFVNIVNEAVYNLKPQIVEDIRGEISGIIREVVTEVLPEFIPEPEVKEVDDEEIIEESEEDIEEFNVEEVIEEETGETEEVTAEPPIEEEEQLESEEIEDESVKADEVVEEEKDTETSVNGTEEDTETENVETSETQESPKVVVDIKKLKDEIVKDLKSSMYDEVMKSFKPKKTIKSKSPSSKLEQYKKSKVTKKSTYLDSDERDSYGRNKKYL